MPNGVNVEDFELTQVGMHAIFTRMGRDNIVSGTIYNGIPTIHAGALNAQGYMPVLTGVGPNRVAGHWIMLIKGIGNNYFLFDPMGEASGTAYRATLAGQLPGGSTLTVLPNGGGLNMGLCGYWVASAGLRAHALLNRVDPAPNVVNIGQIITQQMQAELAGPGYQQITGWLDAVGDRFPGNARSDPQRDATTLRHSTERELQIVIHEPVLPITTVSPQSTAAKDTGLPSIPAPKLNQSAWGDFSLYTDNTVREAITYANERYLSRPYKPGNMEATPAILEGITVNRQTHGLAHTLRTMAYAEIIVDEARKAKLRGENLAAFPDKRTLADVTPAELKKVMIAQAFFVAGREGEESDAEHYLRYHTLSRAAFLGYVDANKKTLIPGVFKDQAEVNHYADIIEDKPDADGKKLWAATPEHVLLNQSHMVDLLRVKQPPESYLVAFYQALQPCIGMKGTDAVFATQRKLFHATFENVTAFDPNNREPHLVIPGYGFYAMENGLPVRAPTGNLAFFKPSDKLKESQRHMTVREYLNLAEVQKAFPGANKQLSGGYPGLSERANMERVSSKARALCETNVDVCLGRLSEAHYQTKIDAIKSVFQPPRTAERKAANADEVAAALIIKQILANPAVIQEDHVSLNGKRLDEAFFRGLLAKCDMAVVGGLLDERDLANIDNLMRHEQNTTFHSTSDPEGRSKKPIGATWAKEYRQDGRVPTAQALVALMQGDPWYYTRLNAIGQNRDKGSSFKEVLISTLMIPSTNKGLADTQPVKKVDAPRNLYRGMQFPTDLKEKLISQSQLIIANNALGLFSDPSAQAYQQMQIHQFSQMFARTCLSNSVEKKAAEVFGNILFDIDDPDKLLHPKRVGLHVKGSEAECSFYLPDDVALIPIQVTKGGPGVNDVIRLVAVKSPDMAPLHERGYAVRPFMEVESAKLAILRQTSERQAQGQDKELALLKNSATTQAALPVRTSIMSRIAHSLSSDSDQRISATRKAFLRDSVLPVLQECEVALREKNLGQLERALARFPTEQQLSAFSSRDAVKIKTDMDNLKAGFENKILLERRVIPALEQCRAALGKYNMAETLAALHNLPKDGELDRIAAPKEFKEQLKGFRRDLQESLNQLQRAAPDRPLMSDLPKAQARYDSLLAITTQRIANFTKIRPESLPALNQAIADFNLLQHELRLLHSEKTRIHQDPAKPIDLSAIQGLKDRLQPANQVLIDHVFVHARACLQQMNDAKTVHGQMQQAREYMGTLIELEKTLDSSSKAGEQKAAIRELRNSLANKQDAYPDLVQLQFKSEALIIRLRQACAEHNKQLDAEKAKKQAPGGVSGLLSMAMLALDENVLNRSHYLTLKLNASASATLKAELTKADSDVTTIIAALAKKSPEGLQNGLGITKKSAEELHVLLRQLNVKTTDKAEVGRQSALIDTVSGTLTAAPIKPPPIMAHAIDPTPPDPDSQRPQMRL